eukprot:m.169717 g.169717  ORF g.169717 m.169717 type:complete len:418 (+) comp10370_c2_seq4:1937-3190(+)
MTSSLSLTRARSRKSRTMPTRASLRSRRSGSLRPVRDSVVAVLAAAVQASATTSLASAASDICESFSSPRFCVFRSRSSACTPKSSTAIHARFRIFYGKHRRRLPSAALTKRCFSSKRLVPLSPTRSSHRSAMLLQRFPLSPCLRACCSLELSCVVLIPSSRLRVYWHIAIPLCCPWTLRARRTPTSRASALVAGAIATTGLSSWPTPSGAGFAARTATHSAGAQATTFLTRRCRRLTRCATSSLASSSSLALLRAERRITRAIPNSAISSTRLRRQISSPTIGALYVRRAALDSFQTLPARQHPTTTRRISSAAASFAGRRSSSQHPTMLCVGSCLVTSRVRTMRRLYSSVQSCRRWPSASLPPISRWTSCPPWVTRKQMKLAPQTIACSSPWTIGASLLPRPRTSSSSCLFARTG